MPSVYLDARLYPIVCPTLVISSGAGAGAGADGDTVRVRYTRLKMTASELSSHVTTIGTRAVRRPAPRTR